MQSGMVGQHLIPLFHGPCAKEHAIQRADSLGIPWGPPVGFEQDPERKTPKYLSVDEARQIAAVLMQGSPIPRSWVIGPVDLADERSIDALLKSLEEPASGIHPVLYAWNLGDVRPTLRSRTLTTYCPAPEDLEGEEVESLRRALDSNAVEVWIPLLEKSDPMDFLMQVVAAYSTEVCGSNPSVESTRRLNAIREFLSKSKGKVSLIQVLDLLL